MIPIKLQLKNFLSYGPTLQTIDFGQYPLICLSGKNGHGKSALLDAITWAIWGQARKTNSTSKADEGLLRLGQTQMQVILEFECNNQHYRIRREFALSYGKSYAALDFGIFNQDKKSFIPLTDKTIKKTQKKIEDTIHLGFESFTNSAFLRQGQANEFSQKMPKDRKEILATILGLNEYEQIKKLANEKMRYCTNERKGYLAIQEKRTQELKYKEELEKELVATSKQIDELKKKEAQIIIQIKLKQKERELLLEVKKNYEIVQVRLKQLKEKINEQQELLHTHVDAWRSVHQQQLEQTNMQHVTEKKEDLTQKINQYNELLQEHLQLKEHILKKKEDIQKVTQEITHKYTQEIQKKQIHLERLTIERQNNHKKIDELEKNIQEQEIEINACVATIQMLKKTTTQQPHNDKKQESELKQFERRKEYYQRYIAQGNWTKQELNALQQKKALVHDADSPSCPLCEQNLSAARRRFLKQKFASQQEFLEHRFDRLRTIITNLKATLITQHKSLEIIKQEAEKKKTQHAHYQELEKTHKKLCESLEKTQSQITLHEKGIHEANKQIENQRKIINELEQNKTKNIENNLMHKKIRDELETINKNLVNNSYNRQEHRKTQIELEKIEKLHKQHIKFLQELSKQAERRQQISSLCIQLKKNKKEKKVLDKEQEKYKKKFEKEDILKKEEAILTEKQQLLVREKEKVLQQKGRIENQKEKLAQVEKEFKNEEKILENLQQTIDDYHAIATATGKDGIQALLIEDAIPEIEQEANYLLAKLTDNQSQIIIESLRDLKKGGTRETLDIKVSDSMGIRPYEMFSGGEAFRIDFALRIAISKLLARRAGTLLQTLIIDEGFGSQDEEGLYHIMDAIYKIQDDFCKVIIVSHLTSIKDMFPVHFFIQKGADGSVVKVIEQG